VLSKKKSKDKKAKIVPSTNAVTATGVQQICIRNYLILGHLLRLFYYMPYSIKI
jgi:hypothetical protein